MSPALADVAVRKVIRVLESQGFEHVRTKGSHMVFRNDGGSVVVVPKHGTVKRGLRQAGLSTEEFLKLVRG